MATITRHGKKRLKQRAGLHKKAAARIVDRAYTEGICRENTKGRLRKWMDGIWRYNKNAIPLLYGEKCYIFSKEQRLITIINIPADLTKDKKKMIHSGNHGRKEETTISPILVEDVNYPV
ncbi:hypothetical protein LKD70_03850 [Ruminococcus sp. CLA-AA-H200]|uniref:50S ribosomal protein L20 n=1 Tax=Ruminococcus turbiniformis TaxID=2881258 RepID=A0ABS8FUC4_9FIRM|nr:hypothetical protein [Ruminococcus turbiniformis]MCC2253577.1 hypothetical protein [Ruminococcus turbiniformis]